MGISWIHRSELYILLNMKFLVVVSALLAAAYADADAEALYHPFGYGLGLSYGYKSAPCVNAANVPVACAHGYHLPLTYGTHLIGKRDADAEPEADADALLYAGAFTSPLVYGANAHYYNGAFPYRTYGLNAAYPAYTGYTGYTGLHGYTGLTGYRHLIGKRDADAEPEADADALLYAGAFTSPLVYGANAHYNNYYNGAFPY